MTLLYLFVQFLNHANYTLKPFMCSQRKSDIDVGQNPEENGHFQGVRIFSQVSFAWSISYNSPLFAFYANRKKHTN